MANARGNPDFGTKIVGRPRKPKAAPPPPPPANPFAAVDQLIDDNLPELVGVLLDRALKNKDKAAAQYLVDRRLGPSRDRSSDKDDQFLRNIERLAAALHGPAGRPADVGSPPAPLGDGGLPAEPGADDLPSGDGPPG